MPINYCSACGQPMEEREIGGSMRKACISASCGHIHWGDYSVGVGALVMRDDRILLVRRAQEPGKGNWTNPGGYIEQLEPIDQTIVREVLEETGVHAKVSSIVAVRDQPRAIHNVYIAFDMEYVSGEPQPDGVEVDQAGFFTLEEMKTMKIAGFTEWLIDVALRRKSKGLDTDSAAASPGNANVFFRA
ncbi:NUDIX domain-containing protein [Paenibacillus sp. NEAU-GSW1]|uniref:NUDIX hydrolase n=1 Tax=Paenibacillus sp. NEAU-GSW1 TaxID=2682486 RepID=UPI0012E270D2|nr:NUDIX hydrolase [Paenibacillus sp. NEAU-GSW1]MUT68711.1 NUDIX domain-containing protein [Paenibacillus sp. NEAU-GSW1]